MAEIPPFINFLEWRTVKMLNTSWIKRLSLFGGNWQSFFKLSILETADYLKHIFEFRFYPDPVKAVGHICRLKSFVMHENIVRRYHPTMKYVSMGPRYGVGTLVGIRFPWNMLQYC